jgi:cytochrome P450
VLRNGHSSSGPFSFLGFASRRQGIHKCIAMVFAVLEVVVIELPLLTRQSAQQPATQCDHDHGVNAHAGRRQSSRACE